MEVFIYVKKLLFVRTIINTKDDFVYKKLLRARNHQLDSNMEMRIANRFDSPIFCHVEGSINFWYVRRDCKNAIWHKSTVQTLNVCTSRPDICQCLVVQSPMDSMSKYGKRINYKHSLRIKDTFSCHGSSRHPCPGNWVATGRAVVF